MRNWLTRGATRYALLDLDDASHVADVRLAPGESGVGVIVRAAGRPVDFALIDAEPGGLVDRGRLEDLMRRGEATGAPASAGGADGRATTPPAAISVAICTRGRPEVLADCLDALLDIIAGAEEGTISEIIVVDNAPDDDATRDAVRDRPPIRYVREPKPGLDFARNRALAEATEDIVAFVDDDAVADPGWLDGLRRALAANPDAGCVTGLILPRELRTRAQIAFEKRGGFCNGFETIRFAGDTHPGNALFPCGTGVFGAGCNMALRRSLALDLGGFDEALDTGPPLPVGGDHDMFYRIVRSGAALVYEPSMLVFHTHRRTHAQLRNQYWNWGRGYMAFAHKTLRSDAPMRGRMLRTIRWWFGYMGREVRQSFRRDSWTTPDMALAELLGGVVGLIGSYPASVRRSRRIRERMSQVVPTTPPRRD